MLPTQTVSPVSSLRQIGSGVPQYRLRLTAQSRAPSSHLPKRPSRMWPGTQRTRRLAASIRSLSAPSTRMNQVETVR